MMRTVRTIVTAGCGLAFLTTAVSAQDGTSCCEVPYNVGFSAELIRSSTSFDRILDAGTLCSASGVTVAVIGPTTIYANIISDDREPPLSSVNGFSLAIEVTGDISITGVEAVGAPAELFGGGAEGSGATAGLR